MNEPGAKEPPPRTSVPLSVNAAFVVKFRPPSSFSVPAAAILLSVASIDPASVLSVEPAPLRMIVALSAMMASLRPIARFDPASTS